MSETNVLAYSTDKSSNDKHSNLWKLTCFEGKANIDI